MVDVKIVVVVVLAVLSVFLQSGSRAQPTISSSSEYDSCSQLKEEHEFQVVEDMRLRSVLESKLQKIEELENELLLLRRLRARDLQSATATFIHIFDYTPYHKAIAKVEDKIYVLRCDDRKRIKVYEDRFDFRFIRDIALNGSTCPYDIVYSNNSKCVYIMNQFIDRILVLTTTDEHRLTKWPISMTRARGLSLSNKGHLLVLRQGESYSQSSSLEIYSLNATLSRRLKLPQDIKEPRHVVQTSTGHFIISHRLNSSSGPEVISQLTNYGQLTNRFIPRSLSEQINDLSHISLDSDNNRLFVADVWNNRVILFDSTDLTWSQVLLSKEIGGISYPNTLFYDASKKHLFITQNSTVTVYEIN